MSRKTGYFSSIAKASCWVMRAAPGAGILSATVSVVSGLFPGAQTWLLVQIFNNVSRYVGGESTARSIVIFTIIFIASFALLEVLRFIGSVSFDTALYEKCSMVGRMSVAEKSSRLALIDYEDDVILDIRQRALTCVERKALVEVFMLTLRLASSLLAILSTVAVLAGYSFVLIAVCVLSMLPTLIMRLVRGRRFYRVVQSQIKKSRRLEYLWSLFSNKATVKEMRAMGFGEYADRLWTNCRDQVYEEQWSEMVKGARSLAWCDVLKAIGFAASLLLAFLLVQSGSIGIGVFSACISAFISLQTQIKNGLVVMGNQSEHSGYVADFFSFLELDEEEEGAYEYQGFFESIQLQDVSFTYPNTQKNAVDGVSMTIYPGQKIAILGENGSGKTTLTKLLLGVYAAHVGSVSYDRTQVGAFTRASFYKHVSGVAQDYMTYDLSLRENIGISDITRLDEQQSFDEVLQRIDLDDILAACGGLDGELGREFGGGELSGGQTQKLALARAMFKNSDLVVLDEPTSALDPLTEANVLSSFVDIARDKTALIVSHRVGLCKLVDRIAVMKDGRLAEFGSHEELLGNKGEYSRIYKAQEQWYV